MKKVKAQKSEPERWNKCFKFLVNKEPEENHRFPAVVFFYK